MKKRLSNMTALHSNRSMIWFYVIFCFGKDNYSYLKSLQINKHYIFNNIRMCQYIIGFLTQGAKFIKI